MAKKSKAKIEKEIQDFFYWERERLIRMPGYKEDYCKYDKLAEQEGKLEDKLLEDMTKEVRAKLQKKRQKIQQQINEMFLRYRTRFMPSPDKADDWKWMRAYSRAVLKKPGKGEWMFAGLSTNEPKLFEIDIWRDKELIKHELIKWIDKGRAKDIRKSMQAESLNKALNPILLKRYYAVFDSRTQNPKLKYRDIALRLAKFYKGKNLEKIVNSARRDYRKAFGIIYGVPYKEYNKKQIKQFDMDMCKKCSKYSSCIKPCDELNDLLNQVELKQQEYMSYIRDASEWGSKEDDTLDN